MAHQFQSSTLSMTLPISCQICLGKVKQPVICANYHVFCACCMETWLKKASQCPTCRVAITADSPCKEIIGGTNESEHSESAATRKCLRKTRGELLLREYEEEIAGLIRENEELKNKNQILESQLQTALDPCAVPSSSGHETDRRVDPAALEEWTNKLRAATDVCNKVKQDMDKLKETNKALRSQNIDLVQENMRLKAEVASRSPQKFGRYTVAALEAKVQQYEREVDRLKKALERSDQYIDDLESRASKSKPDLNETQGACGSSKVGSEVLSEHQKVEMMQRSLSDQERESVCNPDAHCLPFPGSQSLMFMPSAGLKDHTMFNTSLTGNPKTPDLESTTDFLPSTPSSAFRSLTLKSPSLCEKQVAFKPVSYLRKLDFEEFPSPGKSGITKENQVTGLPKFPKKLSPSTGEKPLKSVFWGHWQRSNSHKSCLDPAEESSLGEIRGSTIASETKTDIFQMTSEASMDAAYFDKISELDSMMLDIENSRGSHLFLATTPSTESEITVVPQPNTASTNCGAQCGVAKECDQQNRLPGDTSSATWKNKEDPSRHSQNVAASQVSSREDGASVLSRADSGGPCPTEELSFDLLFDPLEVNDKAGPSGSHSPASKRHDLANLSSSSCGTDEPGNTARDRHTLNITQPAKRKSHSPFNISSPTKLSKLL